VRQRNIALNFENGSELNSLNICMVCPYFQSRKYKMKFRPDILEVSKGLVKRGHNVIALASKTYGAPSYETIDGIEVHRVSSITLPNIFYFVPSFSGLMKELLQIYEEHNIDVFHFWNLDYLTSAIAVFLRTKLKHAPFVLTVLGFPGISWHYGLRTIDTLGLIYTHTIGKLILRSMDQVILLGKSMMKYALWAGVSQDKISVNSFGVNLQDFIPKKSREEIRRELDVSSSDRLVVYVGRLAPVKGVIYLLEAAEHLCKDMKDLKFVIVGEGPLGPRLRKFESTQIFFTGWRDDVNNIINAADIFVLPSLSEGLPISILEAYALGKPVIATNVGAIPDLVVNEKSGLLIAPRNPMEIENAIRYLLENPEIAYAMGVNGKEFVNRHHNWDGIIDEYESLYNSFRDVSMSRSS